MKRGVKACHLGERGIPSHERLDHPNFTPEVIEVKGHDAAQLREQFWRDPLRLSMRPTLHHSVSHGVDRREDRLGLEPVQEKAHCPLVVGGAEAVDVWRASGIVDN